MSALALQSVTKRFGGVVAAEDVTIDVAPGRITGLIGPNGAGKTTIVNLITGMLALTTGRILFGGTDITTMGADAISRLGFARTFQNIRLFKEATVLENLLVGFHKLQSSSLLSNLLGSPAARRETVRARDDARALLDRFDMARYADFPAGSLSYGHQRRVEMMRALAAKPSVLLLDEPVAGMNDVEAGELGAIFREVAASGIAVLLIEHNIRFVTDLCETIHVLDYGRIIASGAPDKVVADPAVIAAYLGT
jgi:branched-chain amino acid transport system ATP-binding protein